MAGLWKFSHDFKNFWIYFVIVKTRCGNFMNLINRFERQHPITINTLLSVFFHIVALPTVMSLEFSSSNLRKQFLLLLHNPVIHLYCPLSTSKIYWSSSDEESSKSTLFCNVVQISDIFWVVSVIFISSTYTDKNNYNLRWKYCTPIRALSPYSFNENLLIFKYL